MLYASMSCDVSLSIAPSGGGAAVHPFTAMVGGGKAASYTKSRLETKVYSACTEAVKAEMGENFARFMSGEK